jgi:hypothetical protein
VSARGLNWSFAFPHGPVFGTVIGHNAAAA